MMTPKEMCEALDRADRLINWMSKYIGKMAPGDYQGCYVDLNEHYLFMGRLDASRLVVADEAS